MREIKSADNKIIKLAQSLKDSKNRKKLGLFLVDGKREVKIGIKAKKKILFLFFCAEKSKLTEKQKQSLFLEVEKLGAEIIIVPEKILNKISLKENSEEIVSVFKEEKNKLEDLKEEDKSLLIVLEGIEKPGNIGAIIRTAYAAGIESIILNNCLVDVYNPNIIRASEGLIFFIKIIEEKKEDTAAWLKKNKIIIVAAETKTKSLYYKTNLLEKTAVILGSEAQGLSDFWLKKADKRIKIPMKNNVDSLNVSVSAAILIYEALRQKSLKV